MDSVKEGKSLSTAGKIVIGLSGGTALALSIICIPFLSPGLRKICLPFVPATTQQVLNIMKALKGRYGKLLDIGSGDGRIVIAAAKNGFLSDGVELNYWLVLYSRWNAYANGLQNKTNFYRQDLWKFYLKPYNNVIIFGVEEMMNDLDKKFSKELINARVIACRFPIPNKNPVNIIGNGIDTVWIYNYN